MSKKNIQIIKQGTIWNESQSMSYKFIKEDHEKEIYKLQLFELTHEEIEVEVPKKIKRVVTKKEKRVDPKNKKKHIMVEVQTTVIEDIIEVVMRKAENHRWVATDTIYVRLNPRQIRHSANNFMKYQMEQDKKKKKKKKPEEEVSK